MVAAGGTAFCNIQEERLRELENICICEPSDDLKAEDVNPTPDDIIRKYNVTTNDVLRDLWSLSAKYSLSETNDEKRLAREMAFMWIGHYGGTNDLAQLETVMTNNADYAQESALFATGDKTSSISRRRLRTASPARKYGII